MNIVRGAMFNMITFSPTIPLLNTISRGLSSCTCLVITSTQQNKRFHTTTNYRKQENSVKQIFDRKTKKLQRDRAAVLPDADVYDYLKGEIGYRLSDRINDISRKFKAGLDLGCGRGFVSKNIIDSQMSHLHMSDLSSAMLENAAVPNTVPYTKVVVDEDDIFPFEDEKFDLVISNLGLHWVNDLPRCFKEIKRVLKDDGVFLASMFSGDTLYQLRSSFVLAELEREGGFAMHISPLTKDQDVGSLLHQAGFTMLTIDTDEITVGYPSMFELMWDLQGMAENNASYNRKPHLQRETLLAAAAIYQEMYGTDEGIPATFQVTYMIGWKPDLAQPVRTAARGSGQVSMKDVHKLDEMIKKHGMQGKIKFMEEMDKEQNDDDKKS